MMPTHGAFAEAMAEAWQQARGLVDEKVGLVGYGVAELRDESTGRVKLLVPFANLVTTVGDEYYAKKGIVGVQPANPSAPTIADGMKLGTGNTAAAKSGAGAALVAYITGSNNPFDTSFPAAAAVGGDGGWNATYKTTWPAGDVTNATILEVALVNNAATDGAGTATNIYSRAVIANVNKTASDSLAITWNHKVLGA